MCPEGEEGVGEEEEDQEEEEEGEEEAVLKSCSSPLTGLKEVVVSLRS